MSYSDPKGRADAHAAREGWVTVDGKRQLANRVHEHLVLTVESAAAAGKFSYVTSIAAERGAGRVDVISTTKHRLDARLVHLAVCEMLERFEVIVPTTLRAMELVEAAEAHAKTPAPELCICDLLDPLVPAGPDRYRICEGARDRVAQSSSATPARPRRNLPDLVAADFMAPASAAHRSLDWAPNAEGKPRLVHSVGGIRVSTREDSPSSFLTSAKPEGMPRHEGYVDLVRTESRAEAELAHLVAVSMACFVSFTRGA